MPNILKRKIESPIIEYFQKDNAPILIVEGARQVGKSFTIRTLGKKFFKNYVEINMIDDSVNDMLFKDVRGIDDMYIAIQSIAGKKLGDSKDTLIFLDEIQQYPHLFTLLKFLKEDNRYKFIASGSLLGITLKKTSSIPIGSIKIIRMYPLDFEEYLWAKGIGNDVTDCLRNAFIEKISLNQGLHNNMLANFKEYLICGGLPYCVDTYLSNKDLVELRDTQLMLFQLYSDDASKYDEINKLHTKAILDMIPSTIENKRRRIFVKDIENKEKARFSDYKEDFEDLVSSGIALETKCSANPVFRLLESAKRNILKLYLLDVGILSAILYKYQIKALLSDEPQLNLGNVYETAAVDLLQSNGYDLFYTDQKKMGKLDFLIDDYDELKVIAVEIKSGKDYTRHPALDNHLKSNEDISEGWVFSNSREIITDGKITYYPIYLINFIKK